MRLLSQKKIGRDKKLQSDDERAASLKAKIKKIKEDQSLADAINDWDKEKKKKWDDFCKWNQELQGKKALILQEVEELEHKREVLIENLQAYVEL